ncbi:MAG: hypothetical protein ACO387_03475 [Flavobacteriaceae bacterium]
MITFQEQLGPEASLTWLHYTAPAQIDWLHTERRELITDEQRLPAEKPREIPLSAIFTVGYYEWEEVDW